MVTSKAEKRGVAKKVAESKSQAKKASRAVTAAPQGSGKAIKGKKPLTPAKKK